MPLVKYVSQITDTAGETYSIKDAEARELIAELEAYTDYLGVTSTEITDGSTTNPITIDGDQITAKKGNIVNYQSKEFIFNGTAWQEFGDLSGLGSLAFKNSASGTYTPSGSIDVSFTGSAASVAMEYTPEGSVSATLDNAEADINLSFTPEGDISGSTTVSIDVSLDFTPEGSIYTSVQSADASDAGYIPTGVIDGYGLGDVTSGTVVQVSSVGTLPTCTLPTATVASGTETLVFTAGSFDAGTLPTTANVSVVTDVAATGLSFSGSPVNIVAEFSGSTAELSGQFSGDVNFADAEFVGSEGYVTGSATVSGDISADFTGTAASLSAEITPEGTISATFSGTQATITVE